MSDQADGGMRRQGDASRRDAEALGARRLSRFTQRWTICFAVHSTLNFQGQLGPFAHGRPALIDPEPPFDSGGSSATVVQLERPTLWPYEKPCSTTASFHSALLREHRAQYAPTIDRFGVRPSGIDRVGESSKSRGQVVSDLQSRIGRTSMTVGHGFCFRRTPAGS